MGGRNGAMIAATMLVMRSALVAIQGAMGAAHARQAMVRKQVIGVLRAKARSTKLEHMMVLAQVGAVALPGRIGKGRAQRRRVLAHHVRVVNIPVLTMGLPAKPALVCNATTRSINLEAAVAPQTTNNATPAKTPSVLQGSTVLALAAMMAKGLPAQCATT